MKAYQEKFLEVVIAQGILRFGKFTLKSGRVSPYFFNAGLFNSGKLMRVLSHAYAQAIADAKLEFDVLFGPAYKGINLACATAMAFTERYEQDIVFSYNRKETKQHGEGGQIIGAPLSGNILMIDDVITAGSAYEETKRLITQHDGKLAGIVIALDREERGQGQQSTVEEIKARDHIPVISIISLEDILLYLQEQPQMQHTRDAIKAYRDQYAPAV